MSDEKQNTNTTVSSRDDFMKVAPEPEIHTCWIPSLGQYVYLKQLSGTDQDSYESEMVQIREGKNGQFNTTPSLDAMRAKYVIRSLCDGNGKRFFRDNEYNVIGAKPSTVIRELYNEAVRINGGEPEQQEATEKK